MDEILVTALGTSETGKGLLAAGGVEVGLQKDIQVMAHNVFFLQNITNYAHLIPSK